MHTGGGDTNVILNDVKYEEGNNVKAKSCEGGC